MDANHIAEIQEEETTETLNEVEVSGLVSIVTNRFQDASLARRSHEQRMIEAYDNFRGLYGKTVPLRKTEKCNIFVKATKTKTLAGYGHVVDIALGGEIFPIGVEATDVPEGIDDVAHVGPGQQPMSVDTADQQSSDSVFVPFDVGFKGDGRELPPGTTFGSKLNKLIGDSTEKVKELLTPGPSPDPQKPTINPAKKAAREMQKLIHDQLEESNSIGELSNAVFESVMLGTGVVKGPFTYYKTLNKWTTGENGVRQYTPITTKVPRLEFVSVWDIYPDPNAACKSELSYLIHRHKLNESQVRNLAKMPKFNKEEIKQCLQDGPNYQMQSYESSIRSTAEEGTGSQHNDRYEVLEYWGIMGVAEAKEVGVDVEEGEDELSEIQVNAWVCNGRVLRVAVNPFQPSRIPYHIFNYERNPYSIFGVGIPENMSDSQQMMNGHARMAVDNLALAGNLVFDIDETALVPGQDMEIYNGKIFARQAGQAGQAVYGIKFPNTAQENMMVFDKFRQIADEETGIPSYSHGQLGVSGMTRTSSGMSMLMGAASLNIKTVIKNLDNQLFKPLGDDYFQWNMQFFEGELDIIGDLEVKALGTNSLMQKEVRSQRLTQFLQVSMNPAIAPYVNIPYVVEEIAYSLDLDKNEVLNSTQEARVAAEIIGLQNGQINRQTTDTPGQQPGGMGSPSDAIGPGVDPGSTGTGDGTIGSGIVPQPGEEEFSG